ncbi:hypothetical protein T484DRAFT_1874388, partial [Baffinella frigidus]
MEELIQCIDSRCCKSKAEKQTHITARKRESSHACGVGILFSVDHEGALAVSSLVPGSPADESGLIRPGDVLHKVDDRNIFCSPAQEVHRLVVGPEGSWVLLGLRMGLEAGDGLVHVALQRRRVLSGEEQLKAQMLRMQEREEAEARARHSSAYGSGATQTFLPKTASGAAHKTPLGD